MSTILPWIAVFFGILAALINLVRRKWLVNVIGLAVQYLCIFIAFPRTDGIVPALLKVIVGLMVALVIYLTILSTGSIRKDKIDLRLSTGELFRGISGVFLILLMYWAVPWLQSEVFPQSSAPALTLGFGLILLGLLQLGSKAEPLYVIIGLLTFLSGFELLYGSLEFSALTEAMFAMVNLLLAQTGAYFIIKDLETETL